MNWKKVLKQAGIVYDLTHGKNAKIVSLLCIPY